MSVHAQALVHPTARLASGVIVDAGARVGAESVLGPGCRLDAYAIVGPNTTLGPGCHVYPFAVVGADPQDRRTPPDSPHALICGARNIFREGSTISRGTAHGGGTTRLGDDNLIMTHAHVGHDCIVGDHNTLANGVSLAGHVRVGDRVTFGGHAGVHQFAAVGDLALVAANAMVSRDVPPYCIAAGDRATLRGVNTTGLRRAELSPETIATLRRAVRAILWGSDRQAAARAHLAHPEAAVRRLAAFVLESQRGVVARHRKGATN